jgi:hypothetical protein
MLPRLCYNLTSSLTIYNTPSQYTCLFIVQVMQMISETIETLTAAWERMARREQER